MQSTRRLAREGWSEYLDAVSAELVNAPVTIELMDSPGPPMLEGRRLALQALAYHSRDDVFEITVAGGGANLPRILRHQVDRPRRIETDSHTLLAPMTIAVDGWDKTRTVITIESEPDSTD